MPENKTKPTRQSVPAFISAIADQARRADARTLLKLMQDACGEKPYMWGSVIIGFGNIHYKYESGREGDMPIVAFSPRKAATVIYGVASQKGLLPKLGKHTTGKGCLYLKKLADVDQKVLREMIDNAVAARGKSSPYL